MWKRSMPVLFALFGFAASPTVVASETAPAVQYDSTLAQSLGADDYGMRNYVLVILRSGPSRVPDGEARTNMFKGHMANIQRLAAEKKLVLAGPFNEPGGWRGMFVFATGDIEEAKRYVATDPVIVSGEMVAEYHKLYGSAGLMMLNEIHSKIQKKSF